MKQHSFPLGDKTIHIIAGNIVNMETDCIVSSDDNYISMGGGVSDAISKKAGRKIIWAESRKHSLPAELGSVCVTGAGRLKTKYIFHAIVIDIDNWLFPDVTIIKIALINILKKAEELKCVSISLPALGTGSGTLDSNLAASAIIDTLFRELHKYPSILTVNIVLNRADTLFDFFELAIKNRYKLDYEAQIQKLEIEKELLVKQLKENSPYKNLPFPIAYLKKIIDTQMIEHSKFTSQIDFFENILKFSALIVFASLYNNAQSGNEIKEKIKNFFCKNTIPGFGTWNSFLDEILKENKDILLSNPITKHIYDFYKSKNQGVLKNIIDIRNSIHGHGATQTEEFYQQLNIDNLQPKLAVFFNSLSFFNDILLITIQDIDHNDDGDSIYTCTKLAGESLIFSKENFKSNLNLQKNNLYAIYKDFLTPIKLSPFIVYENCSSCCTTEPFYLEKISQDKCFYVKPRGNHKLENNKYRTKFV